MWCVGMVVAQDKRGGGFCLHSDCPLGHGCGDAGVCAECPVGQYKDDPVNPCLPCPVNTYQDQVGQLSCNTCESGRYQDQTGQLACLLNCTAGQYENSQTSGCEECPAGMYQDLNGASYCKLCPPPLTQNETGQARCKCPIGWKIYDQFCGSDCVGGCIRCDKGTYQDQEDQHICKLCEPGKFQPFAGHFRCKTCPAGKFSSPDHDKISCKECPLGPRWENGGRGWGSRGVWCRNA